MNLSKSRLNTVWSTVKASPWAGLAGKAGAYLAGFVLLAMVGSGRLTGWLSPPARLTMIPAAEAATAPPPPTPPPPPASVTAPPVEAPGAEGVAPAGPPVPPADGGTSEAADGGSGGVAPDGKVILNLASEEDLRRLPGIGPTRARAILALRARLKKFTRVEDLLKVKGVGRRSLARLRPLVRVD